MPRIICHVSSAMCHLPCVDQGLPVAISHSSARSRVDHRALTIEEIFRFNPAPQPSIDGLHNSSTKKDGICAARTTAVAPGGKRKKEKSQCRLLFFGRLVSGRLKTVAVVVRPYSRQICVAEIN